MPACSNSPWLICLIIPRACARGGAVGLFVYRRCHYRRREGCQASRSGHLCRLWAQLIDKYRWKTGLYALRIAQKGLLMLQIVHFLFSMPVVYRPHPLHRQLLMRLRMLKLSVGKGHQVIKQLWSKVLQYYATVATERTGYVLFRALVIGFIPSVTSIRIRSIFNYSLNHSLGLPEQLRHIHCTAKWKWSSPLTKLP